MSKTCCIISTKCVCIHTYIQMYIHIYGERERKIEGF